MLTLVREKAGWPHDVVWWPISSVANGIDQDGEGRKR